LVADSAAGDGIVRRITFGVVHSVDTVTSENNSSGAEIKRAQRQWITAVAARTFYYSFEVGLVQSIRQFSNLCGTGIGIAEMCQANFVIGFSSHYSRALFEATAAFDGAMRAWRKP
jgi:hypothetical protein